MFNRLCSTALILGVAALAPPAFANNDRTHGRCLPRQDLIDTLGMQYDETLTGGGMQNANQVLEIWSSDTSGSFTVFVTRADGTSCVVASGAHWVTAIPEKPGIKS